MKYLIAILMVLTSCTAEKVIEPDCHSRFADWNIVSWTRQDTPNGGDVNYSRFAYEDDARIPCDADTMTHQYKDLHTGNYVQVTTFIFPVSYENKDTSYTHWHTVVLSRTLNE